MPIKAAPGMSEKTIKNFLGQVSDRSAQLYKKINQFDNLKNVYSDLFRLRKRLGTQKFQLVSHSTGSRTYGMYEIGSYTGTEFVYAKMVDDTLYAYDVGTQAWRNHSGHAYLSSRTYFAEMQGENAYDTTYNVSDTAASGSTTTAVKLTTNTSMAVNVMRGAILGVDYGSGKKEKKVIIGNSADTIFISSVDPLNSAPTSGITVTIKTAGMNMYIACGGEYAKINIPKAVSSISGSSMSLGYDRLDNVGAYSYAARGVCVFGGRLFTWNLNKVRYSDLANGDNFGKDAYLDFSTTVWLCKPFSDNILIIYESNRIWALIGNSPSTWELRLLTDKEGTNRPELVDNYISTAAAMQIYMNGRRQIKAITTETFNTRSREAKTLTLSKNYVQESIDSLANYACAAVSNEGMYVLARTDNTYLVLNLEASERTGFEEWIWHNETRPSAIGPNVFGILSGFLVGGATGSGQLYLFHAPGVYSDDSTAIDYEVSRRGLNFEQYGDRTKFYSLNIAQGPSGGSTTISLYGEAGNTPTGAIDTAIGTYNPSTGNKFRRFRIKNNPSIGEGSGPHFDFKLTESGTVEVADLESIQLTYFPGIIR